MPFISHQFTWQHQRQCLSSSEHTQWEKGRKRVKKKGGGGRVKERIYMASLILNLQRKAQRRNEIHISFYINHWESSLCVRLCGRTMAILIHLSSNTFFRLANRLSVYMFLRHCHQHQHHHRDSSQKIVAISCYQRTWYMLQVLSVTPIWSACDVVCFSLIITFSMRQKNRGIFFNSKAMSNKNQINKP